MVDSPLNYSNFPKDEWQAMGSLVSERSLVIKKADISYCIVVWDREDYIVEAERQLGDVTVYKDFVLTEKILQDLAQTRSKLFRNLENKAGSPEKD